MSGADDFEEKLIEQITEMFKNMGMNLDKEQIRSAHGTVPLPV